MVRENRNIFKTRVRGGRLSKRRRRRGGFTFEVNEMRQKARMKASEMRQKASEMRQKASEISRSIPSSGVIF